MEGEEVHLVQVAEGVVGVLLFLVAVEEEQEERPIEKVGREVVAVEEAVVRPYLLIDLEVVAEEVVVPMGLMVLTGRVVGVVKLLEVEPSM